MTSVRRLIRDISSVLILSGLLLVADAGVTLVWQEPVTAAIGLILRGQVNQRYLSYTTAPLTQVDRHALVTLRSADQRLIYLARREQHQIRTGQIRTGDAIGKIDIPRIGADYDIIQGTDELSLEKGPGHYPETALLDWGARWQLRAIGRRTSRPSVTSTRSVPETGSS
jgi:sortase A